MIPDRRLCPLCGGENLCGMEAGGAPGACWCRDLVFTPELLGRVPEEARKLSCICRNCAERSRA